MSGLLVSVRNASEAHAALAGGAAIVDVKEPLHGSLGAAAPQTVAEVAQELRGQVLLSVALGEILERSEEFSPADLPAGIEFAKFGLAGCASDPHWESKWIRLLGQLPDNVNRVAVAYADWQQALSPDPRQVISSGARQQCRAVLIDTYRKDSGSLLNHLTSDELTEIVDLGRQLNMLVVIAGSVDLPIIKRLASLQPDYFAVRGAVCHGNRTGTLDPERVRQLVNFLDQQQPMTDGVRTKV
jgi:hypothetical protein